MIPSIEGPKGLRGWLILPTLHLITSIGFTAYNLGSVFMPHTLQGVKEAFSSGSEFSDMRVPIFASILGGAIFLVYAIYVSIQFFTKKPSAPKLMIGFYILALLATLIELGAAFRLQAILGDDSVALASKEVLKSVIACCIWIPYFLVSVRVRNTFNPELDKSMARIFD